MMSASSSRQSAAEHCSLGDLLHILPSAARETLYAALKSNSSLPAARLSSRVLRDFIDGHVPRLKLYLWKFNPTHHLPLYHEGRWLQRWSRCTNVMADFNNRSVNFLMLLFSTAPPEACQRITSLNIQSVDEQAVLPSGALLAVLGRLPGLTSLELWPGAPDPDDEDLDDEDRVDRREDSRQAMTTYALSLLPVLRSFSTGVWDYVSCIPHGLAAQLTRLEVDAEDYSSARPPVSELGGLLGRMTSLKELVFKGNCRSTFSVKEALEVLDAVPDTLETMEVSPVGRGYLSLRLGFAGSRISTAAVRKSFGRQACVASYASTWVLLARVLLPSRRLGPRLQLLQLGRVDIRSGPDPAPVAALYARCDKVVVEGMVVREGAEEEALSLMRLTGLPAKLEWKPDADTQTGDAVLLRLPRAAAGRLAVLPPWTVGQRAVERMAADDEPGGTLVLLRGPAVRVLLAAPAAAALWVQQLVLGATQMPEPERPRCTLWTLPSAGAIMLKCASPGAAEAVAAAVRRLAQAAASADGGGAGAGVPALDVRRSSLQWHDASMQVLQALWDGEEGGVEEASGAEAEAGAGGGNAPTSGACTPAELERVRCLLETWRGLRPHSDP